MDLPKRKDEELDAILDELKADGQPLPKVDDYLLDEILADLGPKTTGEEFPAHSAASLPEATEKLWAPAGEEDLPSTGGGPAAGTGAQPAPPEPSLDKPDEKKKEADTAHAAEEAKEAKTEPDVLPDTQAAPAANQEDIFSRKKKKNEGAEERTGIWAVDPDSLHTEHIPRVGKAAALDTFQTGKFTEDEQLQSWFSSDSDTDMFLSKKERKQAEKERKRQLAAERREEKQLARSRGKNDERPEEEPLQPGPLVEQAAPPETGAAAAEAIPPPQQEAPFAAAEPAESGTAPSTTPDSPPVHIELPPAETTSDESDAGSAASSPIRLAPAAFMSETGPEQTAAAPDAPNEAQPEQPPRPQDASDTQEFPLEDESRKKTGDTQEFLPGEVPPKRAAQPLPPGGPQKAPAGTAAATGSKNLYVDEMVDQRFREFFSETVIVGQEEPAEAEEEKPRRRRKKGRTALITGEFGKLAEESEDADMAGEESENDYNRPQDAAAVERDILSLRRNLLFRTVSSIVIGAALLWMAAGFVGQVPLPTFMSPASSPTVFGIVYLGLIALVIGINFTTIAAGLVGLFGEPSVDCGPALAGVAVLLQGVVLLVQVITKGPVNGTLFGGAAALLLAGNALGKRLRAGSVLNNFRLVSSGAEHAAAYVLDNSNELAYHITKGLDEAAPALLISRPTALVKGFLRQSFSPRWSDRIGRILGWSLFGVGILAAAVTFMKSDMDLMMSLSGLAAVLCLGAPLSSALVNAVPSGLLQRSANRAGAVVAGWSAIEELGQVNVVMATDRDIFPAGTVRLRGIKTFQKERIDYAILYAASVLAEGCETLRDLFLGMVENKTEMLYKVENLQVEAGRGFTAWVENNRIVIGTREMLQKHDIDPPSIEVEMKHAADGALPIYLAVSGKLFAMFVVDYRPDLQVSDTLDGLIKSGVSLLITSNDMNVTGELIEQVYRLPQGAIKVLGRRELEILGPLTDYLPESDGVMTHRGSFASFIGGLRAAAGCAASERMATSVQIASVVLAAVLSLILVFLGETGDALAALALYIPLLYQLAWTLLVCALPFARRN